MIVWITSYSRSGNTFFRIVMHYLYGLNTYAAFNASEILVAGGAEQLVGHNELPDSLRAAVSANNAADIRLALDQLEASKELFIFKTHAGGNELFGTNYSAILLVRDGRDALASFANYRLDIVFHSAALKSRVRSIAQSKQSCSIHTLGLI